MPAPAESGTTEYCARACQNGLAFGLSGESAWEALTIECDGQRRPGRRQRNRRSRAAQVAGLRGEVKRGTVPAAPEVGLTRHPMLGAAERRAALLVNVLTRRELENCWRCRLTSGARC